MKRSSVIWLVVLYILFWVWSFFIHPFSESETKEKAGHHNQMVDDALREIEAQKRRVN